MPQGAMDLDCVMFFTYVICQIFAGRLYKGIIVWLDNLLLYAATVDSLFEILEFVLEKAKKDGIKFGIKKCDFLQQRLYGAESESHQTVLELTQRRRQR